MAEPDASLPRVWVRPALPDGSPGFAVCRAHLVAPMALAAAVLSAAVPLSGQPAPVPPPGPLQLVPTPQACVRQGGVFTVTPRTAIVLPPGADADDRFAAQQLVDEIAVDLGRRLRVVTSARPPASGAIVVGRLRRDALVDRALRTAGVAVPAGLGREGYVLRIGPDGICIGGRDSAGTFYGVQTARQIVRANARGRSLPCVTIRDWPTMRYRGWQDDISRGPIPTLAFLKEEIRTLSEFKLNLFTMYTESVFRLKSHPSLAPADGITADEVRDLCAFARRHHVQVAGNFASFGHAGFLGRPEYRHLGTFIARDGPRKGDVCAFNPADEGTYRFLREVYDEIAPAYDSPLFMANCDEVFYLDGSVDRDGKPIPRLDQMVAQMGVGGVYAYHVNRLAGLLARHGKVPMIWADADTVTAPREWGTGPERTAFGGHRDQALAALNKAVVLVAWEYEADYDFAHYLEPLVGSGRRVLVAPGTSGWGQTFPPIDFAARNIARFTAEGARRGAAGMLLTTWDDEGESLMGYQWEPLVWGAECSWSPVAGREPDQQDAACKARLGAFRTAYPCVLCGLPGGAVDPASLDLARLRDDPLFSTAPRYALSTGYFWMGTAALSAQGRADADVRRHIAEADRVVQTLQRAKANARYRADALEYPAFAARRSAFTARRILAARAAAGRGAGPQAANAFETLAGEADALCAEYVRLWRLENRPSSLQAVAARFGRLRDEMRQAAALSRNPQAPMSPSPAGDGARPQ